MPAGKGLHTTGAWAPQLLGPAHGYSSGLSPQQSGSGGRGERLVRQGPTNLDLECKAALQKLLRPSNYNIVEPWLRQAPIQAKKDVANLEKQLVAAERDAADARKAYVMSQEKLVSTQQGRPRLASAVQVTADRQQADLLRNRCGSDAKDRFREAKRQFARDFAPIPNQDSVHQQYCLQDMPLGTSDVVKVLTEDTRRRLSAWQVRGPERNKEASACVMRALRAINQAVEGMPTYQKHAAHQYSGGIHDSLTDYSYIKPRSLHRHSRNLPNTMQPNGTLSRSLSCPVSLPRYIDPQEFQKVSNPGGDIIDWVGDEVIIQGAKNRERSIRHKLKSTFLGPTDWTSTYTRHNEEVSVARARAECH